MEARPTVSVYVGAQSSGVSTPRQCGTECTLARMVHVVLGRLRELTPRVVAPHAILPILQLVRELRRQVYQEGGRRGRTGC